MNAAASSPVLWLLFWPFIALWAVLTFFLRLVGRILCAAVGLALMAGGTALSLTIVGAVFGVPLATFGFLLLVRALF